MRLILHDCKNGRRHRWLDIMKSKSPEVDLLPQTLRSKLNDLQILDPLRKPPPRTCLSRLCTASYLAVDERRIFTVYVELQELGRSLQSVCRTIQISHLLLVSGKDTPHFSTMWKRCSCACDDFMDLALEWHSVSSACMKLEAVEHLIRTAAEKGHFG